MNASSYKSGRLPAVPWLDVHGYFEQVVGKLLLVPVAHGVQVLKELLDRRKINTRYELKM